MAHLHWPFSEQAFVRNSLRYWSSQLRFATDEATLECILDSLERRKPGAYLRFGKADIEAALGRGLPPEERTESVLRELRATFLLSSSNLLKSLEVNRAELADSGDRDGTAEARRDLLRRLNAVGACFLDAPIYSYTAIEASQSRSRLLAAVRGREPVLVIPEGSGGREMLDGLAPCKVIEVDALQAPEKLRWLEEQTLLAVSTTAQDYPVVIVALRIFGRLLARRLLVQGFAGYILDLDDLEHVARRDGLTPRPARPAAVPRAPRAGPATASTDVAECIPVRWEGPFLGHYSYSIINRELASRLGQDDRIELSLRPSDTPFTDDPVLPIDPVAFRSIVERVGRPLSSPARIHIRNHAQHPFMPPAEGRWVAIQPWDFRSLPVRWIEPFKRQIDEIWTPSHYVREAFLQAGIPAERVAVVPNGVDTRVYKPGARKVRLDTRKAFKFLYVGGPFWRKGFDLLLDAYRAAFRARDDVCLVIKSTPEFWTRAGQVALARFQSQADAPQIISLVQSLDPVRMAGLYASCNALVHPYRAEGFAMCVAEGMASGLPVIVTGMGGTADFCNERTAFVIPARAQHLNTRELDGMPTIDFPTYAEPELDALVERMRYIYEHSEQARGVALEGMRLVRNQFTWDRAAQIAMQRLTGLDAQPIRQLTE